ncbi:MAG: DUF429 domain-containing protein [Betaproteobacteria bacterium]|nr:DUF429 domain-containing protein [Betaproteobacteria bacterium]
MSDVHDKRDVRDVSDISTRAADAVVGVDFTSRPSRRKPITLAQGERHGAVLRLQRVLRFDTLDAFALWLAQPGAWVGAFDLPFGLPRELVVALGWPQQWRALIAHYAALPREQVRAAFKAFCDARPVGGKFAHRATDGPAGSSPSMKWVNPPVAYMLHAGVPLLLRAGVHLPGLHAGDVQRVALEGYPGLLARELIGTRSYKSDTTARQTAERLIARKDIIAALEAGRTRLGLRLKLSALQAEQLADDGSGDLLDAALCMVQAAWGAAQGAPHYGLPANIDPLEGWVLSA